jgi:hypothetical protein
MMKTRSWRSQMKPMKAPMHREAGGSASLKKEASVTKGETMH